MLKNNIGITSIGVGGFKSLYDEQNIEIKPLTILAGANSSGKSSIMQPLLMLKQTLEAPYDPGALMLDGPHVKFTSVDQILSKMIEDKKTENLWIKIEIDKTKYLNLKFLKDAKKGFNIQNMIYCDGNNQYFYKENMTSQDIVKTFSNLSDENIKFIINTNPGIKRDRCFLNINVGNLNTENDLANLIYSQYSKLLSPSIIFRTLILEIIHLPGLRGNPNRSYNITGIGETFPGTFENYTASIISKWLEENEYERIKNLCNNLKKIGLTSKIKANHINDTQVEIKIGRLPVSITEKENDFVDIADVGFGVSQTLPVLVALEVAKEGQLVYIEQPETHLHPRAQTAMAEILAEAAIKGVHVVVETHSALLLQGIQTLVAEDKISPDLIKLHWFTRNEDGSTKITSADLNEKGAFGEWPEDFGEVSLHSESRYLDAVEKKHWASK
jgi:predicted ATPase